MDVKYGGSMTPLTIEGSATVCLLRQMAMYMLLPRPKPLGQLRSGYTLIQELALYL